jgi:hypothetical protein
MNGFFSLVAAAGKPKHSLSTIPVGNIWNDTETWNDTNTWID